MAALELRSDYWGDAAARAAFCRFMIDIHRLDFSAWERAGFWDDAYRPFSLFDGAEVVANVCLYSLRMVVNGEEAQVAQISGVGTRPEYRLRGLARGLHEEALRAAPRRFCFLFADEDAVGFYRKAGFVPAQEHRAVAALRGREPVPGARKLDLGDEADRRLVWELAQRRAPVSRTLGVRSERLLMFHALYGLRDFAWHVPALDVVVFASRRSGTLTVYDIVGQRLPAFDDLYPWIADPADAEALFGFVPDALGIERPLSYRPVVGNHLHLSPGAPLSEPFVFPATAQA